MHYSRPLSPLERTWLVADRLRPPFVNQLVVEGQGDLDRAQWTAAVTRAAQANPGSRVALRGVVWWCRWVDTGQPPPVRVVEAPDWDAHSPRGAPFLDDRLDPETGPTTEVILIPGAPARVVFRTHHATMDGRGTLAFVDDVMRCLAGEDPVGTPDTVTDLELARRLSPPRAALRREDCIAPTASVGTRSGITWSRITLPGRFSSLLPRLVSIVAKHARAQGEGRVRIDVPVDLRPRFEGTRSTANLTGMVHVEPSPGEDLAAISDRVRRLVDEQREAGFIQSLGLLRGLPLWFMAWVAAAVTPKVLARKRYISSGVLSNLGRLQVRAVPDVFTPEVAFFIPPGGDTIPLFVALCGDNDQVQLVATAPLRHADDGRLDTLLTAIADELAGT